MEGKLFRDRFFLASLSCNGLWLICCVISVLRLTFLLCFFQYYTVDERNRSTDVFEALNEWLMFGGRDASLEQILLNIDVVQSRIVKLRSRLDSLMKVNNRELAVSQGFPGSGETRHSHALSPSCSPRNNGDIKLHGALNTPPHHVSEHEIGDATLPGSTVSSYGDAAEPDIVESTLDLLSAAPSSQHQFGNSSKEVSNCILPLINNS